MKKLPQLVIVAVVLVAAALFVNRRDRTVGRPAAEIGQPLMPGLEDTLAGGKVQTLALAQGEKTATVELGDGGWTVKEQFGYPADFARLQRVLLDLAKVKVGQVVPGATLVSNETTTVQWRDAAGASLGGVRLGQTRKAQAREDQPWGGGDAGRFVAREGSDKVFLVRETLNDFTADAKSWVDTQIVSVPATDIASVAIEHPDGEKVELTKKDGGDLTLVGLGEKEEFDTSKRYGVGGALSYLRFAEVADPALADDVTGLETAVVYRATTAKGQTYTVRVGRSPEGKTERYARFAVTLEPAEPEAVPENEDEAAKTARETRAKERAELEKGTAELNAKLSPWLFLLNSYNADNMTLRRSALVKAKPEPAAEPAAEDAKPEEAKGEADQEAKPTEAAAEEKATATTAPVEAPKEAPTMPVPEPVPPAAQPAAAND